MNKLTLILFIFSISIYGQKSECLCFNGEELQLEGAEPQMTFMLENGKTYNVCGFIENKMSNTQILISDFNIFDCESGELIFESLSQNSFINFKEGVLEIVQMDLLRFGENWEYETIPTGLVNIHYKDSIIDKTTTRPDFKNHKINQKQIDEFMLEFESIDKRNEKEGVIEKIEKLGALALIGNEKAMKILSDFNTYFNITENELALEMLATTINRTKKLVTTKPINNTRN
ncbi:MAG: hypothetical protein ABJN84_07925 [Flavobacteriaceae bacterium]